MSHEAFDSLPLHDATLISLEVLWEQSVARLHLNVWSVAEGRSVPRVLHFSGVKAVQIPMARPWGPSGSVNSASWVAGMYNIEMQSGDIISVSAESYSLLPSNISLQPTALTGRG